MDKTCKYFTYDGRSSEDFGIILGSEDGAINEVPMGLSRSSEHNGISKYRLVPNHTGTQYDDVLEFEVGFIKDPCLGGTQDDMKFTRSEISAINAWLTSPRFPQLLHFVDFDNSVKDDMYVDYFAVFTNITSNADGDVHGLKFTVTCNAPFAFSQEYKNVIDASSGSAECQIVCTTDERQMDVYPVITIEPLATGIVTIENSTQGKSLSVECLNDNIVSIDNEKLKISDSTGKLIKLSDLGLMDIGNLYWFSLSYGVNDIKITGEAKVTITYREPRKVGAY